SSGTTALHLALLAAGVSPGDEVVTASHSFIATANAIRYCRALPVFVDIDPATFNLVPRLIEAAITPRTRAIVGVHQMGMPFDLAAIAEIARSNGVKLIEDAACAAGSEIHWHGTWQRIGSAKGGDICCFSFHPRKVLTTGDGGMLTTNDESLDHRFRLLRHHGMSVPAELRQVSNGLIYDSYDALADNYRLPDIQAAVGRVQLQRLDGMVARRRVLAARYAELLQDVENVSIPHEPAWARSNWQSYCVRLADSLDQRTVMQSLLDVGVATRRGTMC